MRIVRGRVVFLVGVAWACAPRPAPVSPAEVSELAGRVAQEPSNGALVLRLAAALRAAGRCDTAIVVAQRGMTLAPRDALGPLVAGQCQERGEQYREALATYRQFLTDNPRGTGSSAVRARELLASRAAAIHEARAALAREAELTQRPADVQTVAVLPIQVTGDSVYQPLSRGLAQMLTSDLALLQRFRLVERMQIAALLDELHLGETGRVDEASVARVGLLARAGRMVQGLAAIPNDRDTRLEASVLLGSGEVTTPAAATGRLKDLLKMEKDVVVGLASRMGYTLSEAERRAILENGTQNLAAFLAYSRALEAEDRGDYRAAADQYAQAARMDPGFTAAREGFDAATAAPDVETADPSAVTVQAAEPSRVPLPAGATEPAIGAAVGSTRDDLSPTRVDQINAIGGQPTRTAVGTTTAQPPPPTVVPPPTATGTIRIVFRLP
jgi:tetratricopeptide (TPR) repeat protein